MFGCTDELYRLGLYVLEEYDKPRMECFVPAHFKGVNRLLGKVGFEYEGTLRNRGFDGTIVYDINSYSIVR